ncbi:MAG: DUF1611 domain-containing protein [Roseibium sp.]|nr:DUF1611 domain-containing protein [Roseibium sp.]
MEPIALPRLLAAKRSYAVRRVDLPARARLSGPGYAPRAGDVVLARITSLGSHRRIELPTGRKASLYVGDEVILAYGNRYAPDQYEAYVPETLGPCHMVAAGGIAAQAAAWHEKLAGPTAIEPIGVVCGADGEPVNVGQFALPALAGPLPSAVFGVFGTSMNAGKTETAAALVRGFTRSGYRVGALKITGTASGGDPWLMRDSGAADVLDFTDSGLATTFGVPIDTIIANTGNLLRRLNRAGCDLAVVEIADGLFQDETRRLAADPRVRSLFDGVMFAAGDALGAVDGVGRLSSLGHHVLGISGSVMRSPLAAREVLSNVQVPAYSLSDLQDARTVSDIMTGILSGRLSAAE